MSDVRIFSKTNKESQVSIYAKTGKINTLSECLFAYTIQWRNS